MQTRYMLLKHTDILLVTFFFFDHHIFLWSHKLVMSAFRMESQRKHKASAWSQNKSYYSKIFKKIEMPEKLMFKLTEKCILRARTSLNSRFWHVHFKCPPRCPVLSHNGPPTKSLINTVILGRARENKNKLLSKRGWYFFLHVFKCTPCVCLVLAVRRNPQTQKQPCGCWDPSRNILQYSGRVASGPSLQS